MLESPGQGVYNHHNSSNNLPREIKDHEKTCSDGSVAQPGGQYQISCSGNRASGFYWD